MTDESIVAGQCTYLDMLNKGIIENGLGGQIRQGKQRKAKTWTMKPKQKPKRGSAKYPNYFPEEN